MPIENITLPDYDFLQPIQGELKKLINLHGSVTQQLDTLFRLIANRAGPDEKIVIDTMLRQILKLHDSIPPLIMFGKTDVIEIVSRSILDLIFQFLFISKGDANLKALCYLYCVNRNNLADIEKLYKPQFKEYSNYIGFNEENSSIDEATIKQEKNRLEILLSSSVFDKVRSHTHNDRKLLNKDWFTIADRSIGNLEQLAKRVGKDPVYQSIHRFYSRKSHSFDTVTRNFTVNKGYLSYYDVRFPFGIVRVVKVLNVVIAGFMENITKDYASDVRDEFKKWYLDSYKPLFQEVSKIDIHALI